MDDDGSQKYCMRLVNKDKSNLYRSLSSSISFEYLPSRFFNISGTNDELANALAELL